MKKEEKKLDINTELRSFIKENEMRYFVFNDCGKIFIKKAFKVTLRDKDYFVRFSYGFRPYVLTTNEVKNYLFKTMEEAKAKAEQLRAEQRKKAQKDKEKIDEVTEFLSKTFLWDMKEDNKIKDEYKEFVNNIIRLYECTSYLSDSDRGYISILENYIRTGSIYSQAMSFRKESVVRVKYGRDGSVALTLTNGMEITPASDKVARLVKLIFGGACDSWYNKSVSYPGIDHDKIVQPSKVKEL